MDTEKITENNQKEKHHSSRSHHHHHHHHRSDSGEKRRSSGNSDSQKKVVDERMKEGRWEKVFKPIIEIVMVVGFVVLITAIIWFLMNPEMGTMKSDKATKDAVIEKQEELKAELEEKDLNRDLKAALERIDELEERVEDLERALNK